MIVLREILIRALRHGPENLRAIRLLEGAEDLRITPHAVEALAFWLTDEHYLATDEALRVIDTLLAEAKIAVEPTDLPTMRQALRLYARNKGELTFDDCVGFATAELLGQATLGVIDLQSLD